MDLRQLGDVEMPLGSEDPLKKEPGGQEKRLARRRQKAEQQARHMKRQRKSNKLPAQIDRCERPERGHLWQLRLLLDHQYRIETDPHIPLEEKAKYAISIAHAIAKLKTEADLQIRCDELEVLVAQRESELREERQRLEQERMVLEAERRRMMAS